MARSPQMKPTSPQLRINRQTLDVVLSHLRAGHPHESCGLLATIANDDGVREVCRFFPGDNIDRSPNRFTMDPRQVAVALDEIRERSWSLGAIVHSHPTGPATPSITDLREYRYPSAWMAIVSFAASQPEIRIWQASHLMSRNPIERALSIVLD
jgi:proteasome lid subunit RPN8/RPN11